MKIQISFKDPEALSSLEEDAIEHLKEAGILPDYGVPFLELETDWESDQAIEGEVDYIKQKLEKWVRYNEYVTIEFDLEAGTAKVVEN